MSIETNRIVTLELICDICENVTEKFSKNSESGCESDALHIGWAFIKGSIPMAICPSCFCIYQTIESLTRNITPSFMNIERKIRKK